MTPATVTKAKAMTAAVRSRQLIEHNEHDAPDLYTRRLIFLVARLTSANKDEREAAKREVRELVKIGTDVLQADQDAANLANFANRHEP